MVNKVFLIGSISRGPEVAVTPNGKECCKFSLETSEGYTDAAGARKETKSWHSVVVWGRAVALAKTLPQGTIVIVDGKLQTRSWETKEKRKAYKTEVISFNVQVFSDKPQPLHNYDNPPQQQPQQQVQQQAQPSRGTTVQIPQQNFQEPAFNQQGMYQDQSQEVF